jgi:hypothetical protein
MSEHAMTGSRRYRVGAVAFAIVRLVFVLSLLPLALAWREPFLAEYRPYLFVGLLALPTAFAAADAYRGGRLSRDLLLESDRRLATTAAHGH